MMSRLDALIGDAKNIAVAGHISPDGDCIGACLGLRIYLNDNYPDVNVDVFMQEIPFQYDFIEGAKSVLTSCNKQAAEKYDLLFLLDISSKDRIGVAQPIFEKAPRTVCLDHHRTNDGEYSYFYNDPTASSASEVLFRFLELDRISVNCADAIYMGMAHDSGIFRYSSTSPETMRVAALLMEKGIDFSDIIESTFYQKTHLQQRILGRVLDESRLFLDGKLIVGCVLKKERDELGLKASDLEGIVGILRDTTGVEVSVLLYELDNKEFKASFRSKKTADVSEVCAMFGGGGHVHAAGCKIRGDAEEIIERLVGLIGEKLKA